MVDDLILKDKNDLPRFLNAHGLFGNGAEIGVFKGDFSAHILANWLGKKLYLIDSWRHHKDQIDASNYLSGDHLENLRKTLFKIYSYGERVALIRELSLEAVKLFKDGFFDFIFLDACHDYKNVLADLRAWYPKVRSGGILIGHDFLDGMWLLSPTSRVPTEFGVKSAVIDFAKELGIEYQVTEEKDFPTWYIKKAA